MEELPLDKLMKIRIQKQNELHDEWKKFAEYVAPFIRGNDEIEKLSRNIKLKITMLPLDDIIFTTMIAAERIAITNLINPKNFYCHGCWKKIEKETTDEKKPRAQQ